MSAVPCPMDAIFPVSDAPPVPFASVYVTLTKQEHIRLVMEANSWKGLHRKATERAEWNERRHQHELLKLKLQAEQRETALRAELELAHAKVLAQYLAERGHCWADRPVSSYVFVSNRGNRLDAAEAHRAFYALSRQIGLRGASDSHGPRLQDMRHRFSTNTLVRWYQRDQDHERLLPVLSAYLGHVHVADTQWYLNGSPELMREAMRRLEHCWEGRS